MTVDQIKQPIKEELVAFESKFRDSMKSNVALLDKVTNYIVKRKGKQMRPMFVFLSAKMCGELNESSYTAASLIELLHTATLVHDDVVDDAHLRRGFFSINALWKNKIAVLVGDYLLSRGLLLAVKKERFDILKIVSTAVQDMSEGELLQMEKARKLDIDEDIYFQIIKQKTAVLIASCCAAGACAAGKDQAVVDKMWEFGINVGVAFQMKDDLFDYGAGEDIGKPRGIDIKEKKMTLPLIYTLNNSSYMQKRKIVNIVKNHSENKKKVNELIGIVNQSGGIEYTIQKMNEFKDKALEILNDFDDCDAKVSLKELVNYTVERNK